MKIQIGEGPHRQEFEWDDLEFSAGPGRVLFAGQLILLAIFCLCEVIGGTG